VRFGRITKGKERRLSIRFLDIRYQVLIIVFGEGVHGDQTGLSALGTSPPTSLYASSFCRRQLGRLPLLTLTPKIRGICENPWNYTAP
jgi:hypothetical protein